MSERRAYLYKGVGETVGVVTLDGRPERLIVQWPGDDPLDAEGVCGVARVKSIERAFGAAFVALPGGADVLLPIKPDMPKLVQGGLVEIEIRTASRADKAAVARFVAEGEGEPRVLAAAPTLEEQLRHFVKAGSPTTGERALEAVEAAEADILETVFALPGGGDVAIETTRALTSVDVDLGGREGDAKRAARQANMAAIAVSARVLRLKGLGGLVVFDLVGRGHDGQALTVAARNAFAPDNPGVAIGAISKFGALEMALPRRARPVMERLVDARGGWTASYAARRLARALEREGRADPGGRLAARCAPAVLEAFAELDAGLAERLGCRFTVSAEPGWSNDRIEVSAA
ncbi:RNA-binding protein [Caulobacter flavus]|uniref:RNA-binding protein n=1 Tax=Caulobacter flavus TaxID=1679497 RepID=A0A2N5CT84_9CAUL|nr:ribonuclease E/G [Caulobacter flavus]AYV49216.1 RNA-binding protein [Caulobacter flavus]PLR14862.1 RNA-binding protein [Caulobacter flavus]